MTRRTNLIVANSGIEPMKAVALGTGYGIKNTTAEWNPSNPAVDARSYELYIRRNLGDTSLGYVYQVTTTETATGNNWVCYLQGTNILFGWVRTGGYFYRRGYPFPQDGNWHHVMWTTKISVSGGNKQRCYIDGAEVAFNSSAYNAAAITNIANSWLSLGRRANSTAYVQADLAYLAWYDEVWHNTFATVTPYYDERLNPDARRLSEPVVAGVAKPTILLAANDIVDLSVQWDGANLPLNVPTVGLDNSDIFNV